jgi:hypothetical protein
LVLLFYQAWGAIVALRFKERSPEEVSPADRVRVDALRAVSVGLGAIDVILGACMQARHLVVAMQAGDREQVLRAMCVELIQVASAGSGARERRLLTAADGLAERSGPDAIPYLASAKGMALYMRGRYREALAALDAAPRSLQSFDRSGSVNVPLFAMYCCFFLGKLREATRRAQDLLREAEDRGDVYTAVSIHSTVMVDACLSADDPEGARRHAREAMARWTRHGFHVQHWYAMWTEVKIALYEGNGAAARVRFQRDAKALRRSFLLHARFIRGYTAYVQACAAIAASDPGSRSKRIAEARGCARKLHREGAPWSETLAWLVDAAASNAAGDAGDASAALTSAIASADASGMQLHAWAAEYQLGLLVGGDEGATRVARTAEAMRGEGVRAPARMAGCLVPGRWSVS